MIQQRKERCLKIKSYCYLIVFKRKKARYFACFYLITLFHKLNATHYFIMKIPNKRELQQIASNHFSDNDFKNFMKLDKDCTKEPYSFYVNDTTFYLNKTNLNTI